MYIVAIFLSISTLECYVAYRLRGIFGVWYKSFVIFMPFVHSTFLFYKILKNYINCNISLSIIVVYSVMYAGILDGFISGWFLSKDPVCLYIPAMGLYLPVMITICYKKRTEYSKIS